MSGNKRSLKLLESMGMARVYANSGKYTYFCNNVCELICFLNASIVKFFDVINPVLFNLMSFVYI